MTLDGVDGAIVIGTDRARDGERVTGALELRPREAVVVREAPSDTVSRRGGRRRRRPLPSMTHETDRQHPSLTFLVLALGGISYALLQSLVAPALPDIQHALHTSENSVSWVLTSYLLSASVATPLLGRLGDMYGKERLLMIVLALLAVGTLVSALASSLPLMLVGRVIQGAAGGIFPLAFGIIRDEFPRERVAGAIGLMSALLGVGGGAGVVLAGPIADNLSFHYLFWLPLIPVVVGDRPDAFLRSRVAGARRRAGELDRRGADVARARRRCSSRSARPRPGTGSRRRRSARIAVGARAARALGAQRVALARRRSSTCG